MYRGLREPVDARVIYVDMNAFYASIEQQYHPEFRDKPLAVVSHLTNSGTVLASSYEAKALGVTTGTKLRDAKTLCPDLALAETDARLYKSVHLHLRSVLENLFGPEVRMRSIDEAAVFLPTNWQGSENCNRLVQQLKTEVYRKLGAYIRCSVGIAPNSLLAKLATDLQKPDGLVEITLANTPAILEKIILTDLPGIAAGNASHLLQHDILTPLELYNTPPERLRALYGIWGQYWWWRLHGFEADSGESTPKSLSHEHVLHKWFTTQAEGWPTVCKMADRLIYRLRNNHQLCRHIHLSLSLVGAPRFEAESDFDTPVSSYPLLLERIRQMYHPVPEILPFPVRKVSITFSGICSTSSFGQQLDVFDQHGPSERISQAVELIRKRHGFESVQMGTSLQTNPASLKEQPGFGRIRDERVY